MDLIIAIYLGLMFISLYMFSFFIILTIKNNKKLFHSPEPERVYTISLILPAYNEENNIGDTIKHVMELDYPINKLEVIVINDGSKDNTKKVVQKLLKKYKNLKLIDKPNSGKADSINQGIKIAKGELIAVVDCDSFPSKHSLRKLTGFFNDPEMGAVTSFVTLRNKNINFLTNLQAVEYVIMGWARKLLDFVDSVYVTNGPLSLYRKKYILEVGGFDTHTVTEDIDITWNMLNHGYKTGMCLDARVTTVAPHKFKPWLKQRERWGLGGLQAISKYRKMFFKKGMFGAFILPFVSISIILSLFGFLFSIYLLLKALLVRFLVMDYSASAGASLFHWQMINFYPSVILFYTLILLVGSVSYYNYILYKTGYEEKFSIKRFFKMIFYMIIYLALYPIVWFFAIYRYIVKDYRW